MQYRILRKYDACVKDGHITRESEVFYPQYKRFFIWRYIDSSQNTDRKVHYTTESDAMEFIDELMSVNEENGDVIVVSKRTALYE